MNKTEKNERSKKLRIFFNGLASKQKKKTIEEIEMCSEICMIIIQYFTPFQPSDDLVEKIHRLYCGDSADLTIEDPFVEHSKNLQKKMCELNEKKDILKSLLQEPK